MKRTVKKIWHKCCDEGGGASGGSEYCGYDSLACDEGAPGEVCSDGNRIYFYSDVGALSVLEFTKQLDAMAARHVEICNSLRLETPPHIELHINSFGGSLFDALAAVNKITSCRVPIKSYIDGYAASAGTLISVVAKERVMYGHSVMLIHQLSSFFAGKYEELRDDMKNNDMLMKMIYNIYENHTRLSKKKLAEILKRDVWFSSEECLKYGLVDRIV